jgi:flagellar basal body-associated protein FliL
MQTNTKKTVKTITILILVILVCYGIFIGLRNSDFANLKKYDTHGKSPREMMSEFLSSDNSDNYSTRVTIKSDTVANLGDFEFNIAGNKKLVANISLKYYPYNKESSFNDDGSIKKEILEKAVILRDTAINTMLGSTRARANNEMMREDLRNAINQKLSNGQVKEVYFNKFIIQ